MSTTRGATIEGTIVLADGSKSAFFVSADGWQQWGANTERLGRSVDLLDAIENALAELNP
jgi:hypothetical protein